jgi:23S rRNA (pseudouridine1915-N3)-methyltransferase
MRLIAVGRLGNGPEAALFRRYVERLRPTPTISEIPDGRGSPAEIRRREAVLLLAALPAQGFAVALDQEGTAPDSAGLARLLSGWQESSREVCFLIGGAEGLDRAVLARADATLSLGRLTWPHRLARIMLAEQIYRAHCIRDGHPYHRAGRP